MNVEIRPHSTIGQSAWLDLLRLLKDEAVSDIRGKPKLKKVGGKRYWYDQYRVGDDVIDRYIGEDTDELRKRLDRYGEIRARAQTARKERSRLMRILRAEGYLTADVGTGQILSAMARAGVFRLGGTLVGTQAFRCYEGILGVRIGFDASAQTNDIDVASFEKLSLVLGDTVDPSLPNVFEDLKFDPVSSRDKAKVWRWKQTKHQTLVEFLTPSFNAEEELRPLPALGVSAQSLHFLNYLIAEPLDAPVLYRDGVLLRIPRPERYAIHKLIVAVRRLDGVNSQKSQKDRLQAAFLIHVLAQERPDDLAEAYHLALSKGPAWRGALENSLARLAETRETLSRLEA